MFWLNTLITKYNIEYDRSALSTDGKDRRFLIHKIKSLYEEGYISYPLTDHPHLPESKRSLFFSQAMSVVATVPEANELIYGNPSVNYKVNLNKKSDLFLSDAENFSHYGILPLRPISDIANDLIFKRLMLLIIEETFKDFCQFLECDVGSEVSVPFVEFNSIRETIKPALIPTDNSEKALNWYFLYMEQPKKEVTFREWTGIDLRLLEKYKNGFLHDMSSIERQAFIKLLHSDVKDDKIIYQNP